jgi:DNA polymerase (family X)
MYLVHRHIFSFHNPDTIMEHLITLLNELAIMLDVLDENPFKIRAIQSAARALEDSGIEHLDLAAIAALEGIGKGTMLLVKEYSTTGIIAEHTAVQQRVPADVLAMTQLRGLGAKKVRLLWIDAGIGSITDLEAACNAGKVASTKGFGAKSQENILAAIQHYRASQGLFRIHKAWAEAEQVQNTLRLRTGIGRVEIVGALRQGAETVREIVLLAEQISPGALREASTETVIPCRVEYASPNEFVIRFHEMTSAADYHAAVMTHNAAALKAAASDSEEAFYASMGVAFVPPELRFRVEHLTDTALQERLTNLAHREQMRGLLHVHTTWSDGKHTVRQMADAAYERGYEYIAICDHSKTAVYANGLNEERVKQQHEEINRLNEELRTEGKIFTILKGIESDILTDGSLDYSDTVLETFDVVIVSVHSAFSMKRDEQTARIVRALQHPSTTLLGHPTGRLLLSRAGYDLDMTAVLEAAQAHNKIIEINANPYRLDLAWNHAEEAGEMGIRLAINTDAHHRDELEYMRYGLGVARKAGLTNGDIVNTLGVEEFLRSIHKA